VRKGKQEVAKETARSFFAFSGRTVIGLSRGSPIITQFRVISARMSHPVRIVLPLPLSLSLSLSRARANAKIPSPSESLRQARARRIIIMIIGNDEYLIPDTFSRRCATSRTRARLIIAVILLSRTRHGNSLQLRPANIFAPYTQTLGPCRYFFDWRIREKLRWFVVSGLVIPALWLLTSYGARDGSCAVSSRRIPLLFISWHARWSLREPDD